MADTPKVWATPRTWLVHAVLACLIYGYAHWPGVGKGDGGGSTGYGFHVGVGVRCTGREVGVGQGVSVGMNVGEGPGVTVYPGSVIAGAGWPGVHPGIGTRVPE